MNSGPKRSKACPAALADKREITQDYRNHIKKFLPSLRHPLYEMERAADWLEGWVDGSLPPTPLLDVSARLGSMRFHDDMYVVLAIWIKHHSLDQCRQFFVGA